MEEVPFDQVSDYYPADPNSLDELVRLLTQDSFMNQRLRYAQPHENSLLPPSFCVTSETTILDLGCGPGGWVLEVAHAFPQCTVLGLDSNRQSIEFARKLAITEQANNADFILGNFFQLENEVQPASVDFLHARFLKWFSPDYRKLIGEWLTVVRSGGTICLVEAERHITNSTPFNVAIKGGMMAVAQQGQEKSGQDAFPAVTLPLRTWLQDLGLQHIQEDAFVINFSAGVQKRELFLRDISDGMQSMGARLLQRRGFSEEEAHQLIQRSLQDLWENPQFQGIQYFLSIYGKKP